MYLHSRGVPHIPGKILTRATTLLHTSLQSKVYKKFMGLQSHGNPNFKKIETPDLGVLGQNDIWMQPLWLGIDNTLRGKMVVSPQIQGMMSLVNVYARGLFVHQKCSIYALINLLFYLCRSVWIIGPLVIRLSCHLGASAHPLYPWSATT
jgi:hypothetical protein